MNHYLRRNVASKLSPISFALLANMSIEIGRRTIATFNPGGGPGIIQAWEPLFNMDASMRQILLTGEEQDEKQAATSR